MKSARAGKADGRESSELANLRARLAETREALRAVRSGEVDAVVVPGRLGPQVFTLQGTERPYRVLIESMNEGALTLTAEKTILYANKCFARMVKSPLEKVIGGSFRRFLSVDGRTSLRALLKRPGVSGSKTKMLLKGSDGSRLPVQVSIRTLPKNGFAGRTFAMVVTDMTESMQTEALLRALSHRVTEAQENERRRVALELHDNITQHLCAILFRSQALACRLPDGDGPLKRDALTIQEMLSRTADEVERISRDLRPGVLNQLGLPEVMRACSTEFANRTGVAVKVVCTHLTARPPAATELALYRIFQEALRNIELHGRAHHVNVRLGQRGAFVRLAVKDDGTGFDPNRRPAGREGSAGLGLLGMRERAGYAGGTVNIKSVRRVGTEIEVLIPRSTGSTHGIVSRRR